MLDDESFDGEIVVNIEIYEDAPDQPSHDMNEEGFQDDDVVPPVGFGFLAKVTNAIRTTPETLLWYRTHQNAADIGFDPDGLCLKVCRYARNIPAKYLTAREAMNATPAENRVFKVRNLRRGMVLYFADPNDDNPADHIVTMIGRVKGFDPDSLDDVLCETNSVVNNEIVVVRGSYFHEHWGDSFVFGATWLNGIEFDIANPPSLVEKFHNTARVYDLAILRRAKKAGRKHAGHVYDNILTQVNLLPDTPKLPRVRAFKNKVRQEHLLDMPLLNEAVQGGLKDRVKTIRDEIRRLLDSLPDE